MQLTQGALKTCNSTEPGEWMRKYPKQCIHIVDQVVFTNTVEESIHEFANTDKDALESLHKRLVQRVVGLADKIRTNDKQRTLITRTRRTTAIVMPSATSGSAASAAGGPLESPPTATGGADDVTPQETNELIPLPAHTSSAPNAVETHNKNQRRVL